MKRWKRISLGAAAVALLCTVLLVAGGLPLAGDGIKLSVASSAVEQKQDKEVLFFPGEGEKAVLLLGNKTDTAYRAFVRSLQKEKIPVMVSSRGAMEDSEKDLQLFDDEVDLLKKQTGLTEQDIFLIGYQYGATSLLDQLVNGEREFAGMAILSPVLPDSLKDETLVINGNYSTKDQWLSGLSPQLVTTPTLLLSSAGDHVCDSYTMTLLYHYLSGDEIIHMGGIYQATSGPLTLDIVDGGAHREAGYHPVIVQRVLSFLPEAGLPACQLHWLEPWAKGIAGILILSVGLWAFAMAQLLRGRFCTISYTVATERQEGLGSDFWLKNILAAVGSTVVGLVLFVPASMIFPGLPVPLVMFQCAAWGYGLIALVTRRKVSKSVTAGAKHQALAAAVFLAGILPMASIPMYGNSFTMPSFLTVVGILWGAAGVFLWLRFWLKEEDLLKDRRSSFPVQAACWVLHLVPMVALGLLYGLFTGGIGALAVPAALLVLLAVFYMLALAAVVICGNISWPALAAAVVSQWIGAVFLA